MENIPLSVLEKMRGLNELCNYCLDSYIKLSESIFGNTEVVDNMLHVIIYKCIV